MRASRTPRARRTRVLVLACVGVGAAALAIPAFAKTVFVSVVDNAYQPQSVKAKQGDTVQWDWNGSFTHTVTDQSGMGLYNSGVKGNGGTFSFTFDAAGTYRYFCQVHGPAMSGNVKVAVKAKPGKGGTGTTFTITWSKTSAATDYVFDVQIKRPGPADFVDWMTGQTAQSAPFVPDAGVGKYYFRARLHNINNNNTSDYSAGKRISVQ